MKPGVQRELIPRDDTLRLIGALDAMKDKLLDASQQWELLDELGHVPAEPSYAELLQHAADAQDLSRDVLRLAADFARSAHSTNRAGSAVSPTSRQWPPCRATPHRTSPRPRRPP